LIYNPARIADIALGTTCRTTKEGEMPPATELPDKPDLISSEQPNVIFI